MIYQESGERGMGLRVVLCWVMSCRVGEIKYEVCGYGSGVKRVYAVLYA